MNRLPLESRMMGTDPGRPGRDFTYIDYVGVIGSDLAAIARIVGRQIWVALTIFILVMCVGFYVMIFSTPIYRAEVITTPRPTETNQSITGLLGGGLGSIGSLVGFDTNQMTRALVVSLTTRSLVHAFIEKYDIKRVLFPSLWDPEVGKWKLVEAHGVRRFISDTIRALNGSAPPPPQFGPTDEEAKDAFLTHVSVNFEPTSNIIRVSVDWIDPTQGALWANGLVDMLNELRRNEATATAQIRLSFLQKQLEQSPSVEIRQALYVLMQRNTETIVLANSQPQFALQVMDPAVPNEARIWPRRGIIIMGSAVIGVFLAILGALLWNAIPPVRLRSGRSWVRPTRVGS